MTLKKEILFRVGAVYVACLLFGLIVLGRIIQIQYVQGNHWKSKAQEVNLKDIIIKPERGNILDEELRLLASSVPNYEIRMDLKCPGLPQNLFYEKVDSLALCLSQLFKNKTKSQYKSGLLNAYKKGNRFYLIKKNADFLEVKACKTFPIFRRGQYKGGVIYFQTNKRVNPHNMLAKRTIGYLNKGESGNEVGLEGAYDHILTGVEGVRLMQKISGNIWMPVNDKNEIEPQDGYDLVSTININLQDVAHHSLKRQLQKFDAEYGSVVLMEVKTGEVKAIVNLEKNNDGSFSENYNYAIGKSVEPGSTFKLPVLMAALEDGYITLDDSVDTRNGTIYYYDKKVVDSDGRGHGWVTVKEAFEISTNVGVSSLIVNNYTGHERQFIDRLYQMGLNKKLDVDIIGEGTPYVKYPGEKHWSGVSLPQIAQGYEVRLTPLQTLAFYNAVANNGKLVKPRFVKEIYLHGKKQKSIGTEVLIPSICSKSTLKKAHLMLEGVVENGTARILNDTPFRIAGKTGTAKLWNRTTNKYEKEYEASFCGYFPAEDPLYSCIVVVHKPKSGGYYGAEVAAPVFKDIANKVYVLKFTDHNIVAESKEIKPAYTKSGNRQELEYVLKNLDIPIEGDQPQITWVNTTCAEDKVKIAERKIIRGLVPDVRQMGAKDAIYLLENAGLRVKITGRGTVLKQSITPGSHIENNEWIELEMSVI